MKELTANRSAFATLFNRRVALEAMKISSEACGVGVEEMTGAKRSRNQVAFARQLAMYLCHVVGRMSLRDVAREMERDRTTVSHACHQIEDRREDETFERQISLLESELRRRIGQIEETDVFPFADDYESKSVKRRA